MLLSEEDGDRVIMWMLSLMFLYKYHKSRDSLHDEHYETLGCRANEEGELFFFYELKTVWSYLHSVRNVQLFYLYYTIIFSN